MASNYEIPSWAGKPPTGLHLDVLKDKKLIQKLMLDQKRCYLFGRNAQLNDFCIDHQSCSRIHAALVYHKHLNRAFLVDLGSTHGTFIGNVRLEANKPTQLPVDSLFHFGASTRMYIIRERPQTGSRAMMDEIENTSGNTADGSSSSSGVDGRGARLLGLPETETELDNLTEFNTAHNRRITMLGIPNDEIKKKRKIRITFNEDEEIINPEDVDPSVGRFRNMIETTVIPKKRPHSTSVGYLGTTGPPTSASHMTSPLKRHHGMPGHTSLQSSRGLYDGLDTFSSKLGIPMPNPAPEIDLAPPPMPSVPTHMPPPGAGHLMEQQHLMHEDPNEPKKKKYAKEAWPGRKPNPLLV